MRILVFGNTGMVGRAIYNRLRIDKGMEVFGASRSWNSTNMMRVDSINYALESVEPDVVINCAGKVGGILSQDHVSMAKENSLIGLNLIQALLNYRNSSVKLINISSCCVYSPSIPGYFIEDEVFDGSVEESCAGYANAKRLVLSVMQHYIKFADRDWLSIIPPNVYHEDFIHKDSHALASLIRAACISNRPVALGKEPNTRGHENLAIREFIHADDLACFVAAALDKDFLGENNGIVNCVTGDTWHISGLTQLITDVMIEKYNRNVNWRWITGPIGHLDKSMNTVVDYAWRPVHSVERDMRLLIAKQLSNLEEKEKQHNEEHA